MDKSVVISAMRKFHFGRKIFCSDGEDGMLISVAFDRTTRRMTHIGVKQGHLFGKTVYLPYTTVVEASRDGIHLHITRAELATTSHEVPGGALLDSRSVVRRVDSSEKGTLMMAAIEPENGELAYIVAHHLRSAQDTLLRQESISQLEPGRITVSLSEADLQAIPAYRSDDELQREVEAILYDLTLLHVDFRGMNVCVLDSVLYLEGNISSSLRAEIVQDQAMGVEGLLEIENHLIGDDKLASDLALALSHDPRTCELPIGVYPKLGDVRLSGAVHGPQQKAAAEEIARSFPAVRSVLNTLLVDPKAEMLHVMSSSEGGETEDKVPGKYVRHTK